MATEIGNNWVEFETLPKAKRYLKKNYDKTFKKGSDENKQIKKLFDKAKKEDLKIGIIRYKCRCGWEGEDPVLEALSPEGEHYKKVTSKEDFYSPCAKCREAAWYLQDYGLNKENATKVWQAMVAMKREQHDANRRIMGESERKAGQAKQQDEQGREQDGRPAEEPAPRHERSVDDDHADAEATKQDQE